jgi:hypothetical protein
MTLVFLEFFALLVVVAAAPIILTMHKAAEAPVVLLLNFLM